MNGDAHRRAFDIMARSPSPKLLVDEVTARIRDMIVGGQFAPGAKLSESALAAELAVSTTPVREAIAALRNEGLVHVKPQSGTYVFALAAEDLDQLCALRATLEPEAVRLALLRPDCRLGEDLSAIVAEMQTARHHGDVQQCLALDTRFHQTIIDAAGNPYFGRSYMLVSGKMAAMRYKLGRDSRHMGRAMAEHEQIAELIQRGAAEAAGKALVDHIIRKEGSYWDFLLGHAPQGDLGG